MLSSHLVYISILISEALAQTPSNYVPSSSQSLQTAFGGVNVTAPGALLLSSRNYLLSKPIQMTDFHG